MLAVRSHVGRGVGRALRRIRVRRLWCSRRPISRAEAPKVNKEEKRRLLEDRAARLSSFAQHPHWGELCAEFERKRARNTKVYDAYLKEGDHVRAQREYDRAQGFDEALRWVQRTVEQAEDTLTRVLRGDQQKDGDG